MSEAIKPTPGEWRIDSGTCVYALNEQGYNRFCAHVQPGNSAPMERTSVEELEAVAALIADAGNTYNATGLTPRQLVARVKELEEALQELLDREWQDDEGDYTLEMARKRACAALSKSLPNTVAEVK